MTAPIPVWVCGGCEQVLLERPAKTTHRRFTKSDGWGQTRVHGRTWSVCGPIEERRIVPLPEPPPEIGWVTFDGS